MKSSVLGGVKPRGLSIAGQREMRAKPHCSGFLGVTAARARNWGWCAVAPHRIVDVRLRSILAFGLRLGTGHSMGGFVCAAAKDSYVRFYPLGSRLITNS